MLFCGLLLTLIVVPILDGPLFAICASVVLLLIVEKLLLVSPWTLEDNLSHEDDKEVSSAYPLPSWLEDPSDDKMLISNIITLNEKKLETVWSKNSCMSRRCENDETTLSLFIKKSKGHMEPLRSSDQTPFNSWRKVTLRFGC